MKKVDIYSESLDLFLKEDTEKMEICSGADYDRDNKIFLLEYFGHKCTVSAETGEIDLIGGAFPLIEDDRTLILQYMVQSSGLPPRGNWISFLELPGGPLHYTPLQNVAFLPLVNEFGNNPEGFKKAARGLHGRRMEMGDLAFKIYALPKLPLALIFWFSDDEFPARTAILYDESSQSQLTTASLWVLGCRAASIMINLH
ncbi:MAG TPA: DUF3786 domain-containing protein [Clostridia bacterium]|nr:DUF3786 domain-containing protein [Clostridia bacterium]